MSALEPSVGHLADHHRHAVVVVAHDSGPNLRLGDSVFLCDGGDCMIPWRAVDFAPFGIAHCDYPFVFLSLDIHSESISNSSTGYRGRTDPAVGLARR